MGAHAQHTFRWTPALFGPRREKTCPREYANNTGAARPACASAQSDPRLCYSLFEKYHLGEFSIFLPASGDLFETRFVGNTEDRFSRGEPICGRVSSDHQMRSGQLN